jgi:hypothetical protein
LYPFSNMRSCSADKCSSLIFPIMMFSIMGVKIAYWKIKYYHLN